VGAPPDRRTSQSTNSYAGDSSAFEVLLFLASSSRWELVNYAGTPRWSDYSTLRRQLRWGSPAKLGTFRRSDCSSLHQLRWGLTSSLGLLSIRVLRGSCYVSLVCCQGSPCCSDQGADLRQHFGDLDTHMTDDVGKLSRLFFDPATRFILHLLAGSGTKWLHFTLR